MDKNTITGIILIFLVLIGSQYFFPSSPNVTPDKPKESLVQKNELPQPSTNQTVATPTDVPASVQTVVAAIDTPKYQPLPVTDVVVENALFKAVFTSKNGAIKSWELKKYRQKENGESIVNLIVPETENLTTEFYLNNGTKLEEFAYEVSTTNLVLDDNNKTGEILFTCKDRLGKTLFTKKYTFYNDKYSFDYQLDYQPIFDLVSQDGWSINWKNGLNYTEITRKGQNLNREDYYTQAYYKKNNDKIVELEKGDDPLETTENIDWGSTRTKYFEVFISTKSNPSDKDLKSFDKFAFTPTKLKDKPTHSDLGISLFSKKRESQNNFQVYIGPMDNEIFKSYNKNFEQTLNWGWDIVKPFSFAVLWSMKFLHKFIDNYGLVIILLSIIVFFLTAPLNAKSIKSTMAMKKIQPMVKDIKTKYKGDLQKQQAETMQLYKQYGVNPLGACLPALIPMPVLYGMFIIFGATIEFRDASFMMWVTDLSLPEAMIDLPFDYVSHIGLLPVLMSVMTFFQMKDSLTDPNQKMTVYIMPIFLLVLFNNLAAGLNLYYFVSNVLRFVQQKMLSNAAKSSS